MIGKFSIALSSEAGDVSISQLGEQQIAVLYLLGFLFYDICIVAVETLGQGILNLVVLCLIG